jgi:hypothetical protein
MKTDVVDVFVKRFPHTQKFDQQQRQEKNKKARKMRIGKGTNKEQGNLRKKQTTTMTTASD